MRTDRADRRLGYHFGNEVGEGAVEGFGAVIEHNGLFFRKCADGAGDGKVGVSDGDQRAQAKAVLDGALLVLGLQSRQTYSPTSITSRAGPILVASV